MSSELYIPPKGIYFRLLGYLSQNVIVSRTHRQPEVDQITVDKEYPDQYFTLIHGSGKRAGLYAIKSKETGKVLFSRSEDPKVWHIGGDGQYDDNWFKLEAGKGQYAKQFLLITPSAGRRMFSRTHAKPYLSNVETEYTVYSDQYFSFLFEDMRVDSVEYDLKLGKIISSTPVVLANQTLKNDSNLQQEMIFQLTESATHTSTFEYSTGFTISVGATFSAGVPLIAEAEFTVDISTTNQWTWGESTSFSKTYTATFPVKAGPNETVTAVSTVNKGTLEVPYTIHLSSKSTGTKVETKGVWRGVSSWDLRHTISNN